MHARRGPQADGRVSVPRPLVARIVQQEDGTVREITRIPPAMRQEWGPERKTDVQELLARPRPSVAPTAEGAPPARDQLPGSQTCAHNAEDFSQAQRLVVAPNIVRFRYADRWVLVEIRGLQPAEALHPEDSHYLDQVLRTARTITLANRGPRGGDRYEATVCVDGKDVAENPYLVRFRMRQPAAR